MENKAKQIRLSILDMITSANSSHIGSAFSIVEILTVLFHKFINTELIKQKSRERDYFILSKGHAASALYATLASVGIINSEILKTYYQDGSILAGHPCKGCVPGVEVSSGSLGHGLSLGVGIAIACKNDGIKNKIYVLLGDGECQEGAVWEAVMMAVRFELNNLIIIIDNNKLQALGRTNEIVLGSWEDKFKGFGCNCIPVDGHDFGALILSLSKDVSESPGCGAIKRPHVIIADTIKGKGVSFMQDCLAWHYKSPKEQEYEIAKKQILGEI